jgi:hypothetical protein
MATAASGAVTNGSSVETPKGIQRYVHGVKVPGGTHRQNLKELEND